MKLERLQVRRLVCLLQISRVKKDRADGEWIHVSAICQLLFA